MSIVAGYSSWFICCIVLLLVSRAVYQPSGEKNIKSVYNAFIFSFACEIIFKFSLHLNRSNLLYGMVNLEDEVLKASIFIQGVDSDCPWSDEGLPTFLCVPTTLQHRYKHIPMLPCIYFSAPESSSQKPKITTQKPEHDHVRVSLEYLAEVCPSIY